MQCAMLILFQNKLIYMGYIPPGSRHERLSREMIPQGLRVDQETIVTADQKHLQGLVVSRKDSTVTTDGPVMVYFQGNAGNMIHRLPLFDTILAAVPSLTIVGICYRGFGSSGGRASEKGLCRDADAILAHVQRQFSHRPIYLYGHSLGGGVAIDLLHRQQPRRLSTIRGLIIENTYTSILDMVKALYPRYTPYPWIAKHFLWNHWKSRERIRNLTTPILFLSSQNDEIVPSSHMESLYQSATSSVIRTLVKFPRATHMDMYIVDRKAYQTALAEFISSTL
ncbi:Alpha/Beta hydrolase protein [Dichotomocladium elegans]|nr:Alpha/Beta hydrolase protein [Dichotomocladium elegans]